MIGMCTHTLTMEAMALPLKHVAIASTSQACCSSCSESHLRTDTDTSKLKEYPRPSSVLRCASEQVSLSDSSFLCFLFQHAALLANREQNRRENLTELKVLLALLLGLPVSPLHISIIMGCQRFMHYRDMGAAEQRCLLKASKSTDFNRNWGLPACLLACQSEQEGHCTVG